MAANTGRSVPEKVHLVGIGGAHMSAIGRILLAWGHQVSGSDLRRSPTTDAMAQLGARVAIGPHIAENVGGAVLVVTTSAATSDNPELTEARRRDIPVIKRSEMVARLMQGKIGVGIAGCHGKSTTSGLVAYILVKARRDPTYLIGADVPSLGTNAAAGSGPHVVVEADEYDRAFLSYHPQVALVTNVEPDHLDYYRTWEALLEAYRGFVSNVPAGGTLVLCADNEEALALREYARTGVNVETYSMRHDMRLPRSHSPQAGWYARLVRDGGSKRETSTALQRFEVIRYGEKLGEFATALPEVHGVSNALGAIIVCTTLGLGPRQIGDALRRYGGVRRRFELIGEAAGVTVMDDYAHHPTEVAGLHASARARFPGRRVVVLFQPHTYARTRYLLDGWRQCFAGFDRLFLLETYAAREAIADGMTAAQLAEEIDDPRPGYAETFDEAADLVAKELLPGDVFFTVGAGDVDSVGPKVLERLRSRGGSEVKT